MKDRLWEDERRDAPGERAEKDGKGGKVMHVIGDELSPCLAYLKGIEDIHQLCFKETGGPLHPLLGRRGANASSHDQSIANMLSLFS